MSQIAYAFPSCATGTAVHIGRCCRPYPGFEKDEATNKLVSLAATLADARIRPIEDAISAKMIALGDNLTAEVGEVEIYARHRKYLKLQDLHMKCIDLRMNADADLDFQKMVKAHEDLMKRVEEC